MRKRMAGRTLCILAAVVAVGGIVFAVRSSRPGSLPVRSTTQEASSAPHVTSGRYVAYSKEAFEAARGKKRVYYFWAAWCPTCKVVDQEFSTMSDKIPSDVIVFKTNYDTELDLKKKYTITYQHTFVQIDENGNEITKWNGGGTTDLLANVK